jgi:hypothetical protein
LSRLSRPDLKSVLSALGREQLGEDSEYRRITVHRYFPRDDSGETFRWFNFNRDHVTRLIRMGFDDTIHHDCAKNKCIVPQPEPATRRKEQPAELQPAGGRIAA